MVKKLQLPSNLRLPFRGLMVLLALLIIITLLYTFVFLPSIRDDIYQEKMLHTRELIDAGMSVIEHYYELEQQQELSREEARQSAANMVRSLRYGEAELDYFWIIDLDATVIVHPFRPDLEGENVYNYQDPEGLYLFQEMITTAKEKGAGHVTYSWQYYDLDDHYEEKLSYIELFEPWGWIIGTGVYLKDLEAVIAYRRNVAVGLTILFFFISAILVFFYFRIKVQENKLLESEEKYRLIAENTADIISILDLNLRHLYVSPSVYRIKGFTPEEAQAMNLEQTLTPESAHWAVKTFCRQLELEKQNKRDSAASFQVELEEYCKDGSVIWMENSVSFVHGSDNEPIGIIAVSRDITERKRQQEIIEKEQKEKSIILDNLAEQVTYKDTDLRLIWANDAACKRYNKEPGEYVGQKCYKVWYGTDRICENCQAVKAIEQGRVCQGEVITPDGEHWLETASPVFDEEGNITGVIGTSLNITELKQAEQQLKKLNEELEER
ncbi:MAG: cache domain-containing protein, partial [Bacillota bacterium]